MSVPSAAAQEAVPVLLVPGWFDEAVHLEPLRERFISAGWEAESVEALTFDDPVGSNRDHAGEIGHAAARLRERTGAPRVDIVAHSMGGLAVRYFLKSLGGEAVTRRVVFLGTPQRGTLAAYVAWGDGGAEMEPGSDFLEALNEGTPVPDGVEALTIRTRLDLRIFPAESATLPSVPDLEVCCPTHQGLVDDDETFEHIHAFLAGAE